jgi:hypothetical protein
MIFKILYNYLHQSINYLYQSSNYLKEITYYNEFIDARKAPYFKSDRYDIDDLLSK